MSLIDMNSGVDLNLEDDEWADYYKDDNEIDDPNTNANASNNIDTDANNNYNVDPRIVVRTIKNDLPASNNANGDGNDGIIKYGLNSNTDYEPPINIFEFNNHAVYDTSSMINTNPIDFNFNNNNKNRNPIINNGGQFQQQNLTNTLFQMTQNQNLFALQIPSGEKRPLNEQGHINNNKNNTNENKRQRKNF